MLDVYKQGGGEEPAAIQFTNDTHKLFLNLGEKALNRRLKIYNPKKFWIQWPMVL